MMQAPDPATPAMQALPLRDIKLPAEPGFWPLAPGWWVLIVLVVVLSAWIAVKWYRHWQRKKRWQSIDEQLSAIEYAYRQDQDSQKLLTEVSAFLRRFVRFQLQHNTATSLAGEPWIAYLNQFEPSQPFADFVEPLTQGPFQPACEYDAEALLNTTRQFIKNQVMRPTKLEAEHV